MENDTSDGILDGIKPVFNSDGSFISGVTILAAVAFAVTLFSVYLMVCISRIKGNASNNQIKPILHLAIIDTTVGVALICRAIFAVFHQAKQRYETCAVWCYIFVALQSVSFYHILDSCIHRFRVIKNISKPVPIKQGYSHGVKSLAIWIAVILVTLPPFVVWMRPGEILMSCRIDFMFITSNKGPAVYLLIVLCSPWLVTNILYISIIQQMSCHSRNKILPQPTSDTTRNSDRSTRPAASTQQDTAMNTRNAVRNIALNREKNIVRTIGILLLVFNISILSYIVILFESLISNDFIVPWYVFTLALTNNLLNPFVYAFSITILRQEMKNTFLVKMWKYFRSRLM